jgi:Prenyltransferase and squalene oxidase repeat
MAMNTPQSISPRWLLRALCTLGLALAALAASTAGAGAYVTPAQAEHAADRGAGWFQASQDEDSGSLDSDWAMTALAAADLNAADVRASLLDPSAQDFYFEDWEANGPGGSGTDAARGILTGVSGGIQPSRLSTSGDATKSNLVARLAELFGGTQIGDPGLLNDDIFGVLALHQAGAPQPILRRIVEGLRTRQLADGGWTWNNSPGAPADTDMTGSALAAFCAAGVGVDDPDLQQTFTLLHSLQDPATGGFVAPPESFGIGVNADTTAWVTSGLIQCGIDPQAPEWTTDQGKTPLDYLVSLQRPDGHFAWTADLEAGPFPTWDSVRPLGGIGFSTEPPARLDGVSPAMRPAGAVADGTEVPVTLAIDHGPGADDVRMCRVDVPSDSGLEQVLDEAEASSTPEDCVVGFEVEAGPGVDLSSLNGVAEAPGYEWRVRIDGGAAQSAPIAPIGFGDLVFVQLRAIVPDPGQPPRVEVPPVKAPKLRRTRGPRVKVLPKAGWDENGVAVRVRCPRGNGAAGCRGTLLVQFRKQREGKLALGGETGFAVESGSVDVVSVPASASLRESLAGRAKLKLRITAATRAEDGAVRLTHARRFLAG